MMLFLEPFRQNPLLRTSNLFDSTPFLLFSLPLFPSFRSFLSPLVEYLYIIFCAFVSFALKKYTKYQYCFPETSKKKCIVTFLMSVVWQEHIHLLRQQCRQRKQYGATSQRTP